MKRCSRPWRASSRWTWRPPDAGRLALPARRWGTTSEAALRRLGEAALAEVGDAGIIGLGSGSTVAGFVEVLGKHVAERRKKLLVVPSSLQIQLLAEDARLRTVPLDEVTKVDLVVDGADQIDARRRMIKGGGGALLREKLLYRRARRRVILADASKFARWLTRPVPVECVRFARRAVEAELKERGATPTLRMLDKGYPFVTENGNLIVDAYFGGITEPSKLEAELTQIPGVVAVGLFTLPPDTIYRVDPEGTIRTV